MGPFNLPLLKIIMTGQGLHGLRYGDYQVEDLDVHVVCVCVCVRARDRCRMFGCVCVL